MLKKTSLAKKGMVSFGRKRDRSQLLPISGRWGVPSNRYLIFSPVKFHISVYYKIIITSR